MMEFLRHDLARERRADLMREAEYDLLRSGRAGTFTERSWFSCTGSGPSSARHDTESQRKGGVAMKSIRAIARSVRVTILAVMAAALLVSAPALAQDDGLFCWTRHNGEKICAI
jgi:hypothetical protein